VISPFQRPIPTEDNTATYKQKRQTSIPSAGFEPAIPATKRPQTYALDHAVADTTVLLVIMAIKAIIIK
jgi:hypothetical protein